LFTSTLRTGFLDVFCMPKRARPYTRTARGAKAARMDPPTKSLAAAASEKFEFSVNPALTGTATLLPTPEKAETDKKEYRALKLKNGVTVLLVSDMAYPLDKLDEEEALLEEEEGEGEEEEGEEEEDDEDDDDEGSEDDEDDEDDERPATKANTAPTGLKNSAAALCINIGSFNDPEDIPGLAHFLEHMVFMGTEKYPDENSFDAFNRKYGGYDNASTDCETTNFYFEIPRKHVAEGLDRFAQFFVSPLMKQESMEREREAVDSEFQMALPSDYNRIAQIYGGIASGHPMAKFMWGNKKSLAPEGMTDEVMHQRLHEFRLRHYSSHYMTLAFQSQHTLDQMQEWIEQIYSVIPNNSKEVEEFSHLKSPFAIANYHKLYKVIPIKDVYQVDLAWSLPPLKHTYRTKPLHYMSWIIGHEGKGSLLSYLRKKVWALSLYAGCQGDGFEFNCCSSMFTITVVLTKAGFEHLEDVLRATFGYLAMMKAEGPNSRIFQEIQEIERLDFMYREEKQASDNVETLAENMQFYPSDRFLDGDDLLFDYDADLIQQCTQALDFETVNMFVKSRDFNEVELDQVEPWFGTKFARSDIPSEYQLASRDDSLKGEFHLPVPNIFIAKDLELKEADVEASRYPIKLLQDKLGELFYKKDTKFLQPRAYIHYHIRSPLQLQSLHNSILLDLLVMCTLQVMIEDVYPADLAQLSYSLYSNETGLMIKVNGLSDKLPAFLETILGHIRNLSKNITPDLFQAVMEQQRKDYYNHSIKPKKLVRDVRLSVLQDIYWSPYLKYNKVRDCTVEELKEFTNRFLDASYLQGLVQGNITAAAARQVDDTARRILELKAGLAAEAVTELRCMEVLPGTHYLQAAGFSTGDTNTMVTNYYQAGPGNIREHAVLDVITMLMEEPVFDTLRTQEQLGYSVFNTMRNTYGVLGLSVTVNTQATKFTSEHVDGRIEKFLESFPTTHLTKDKITEGISTLSKLKVKADVMMEEEVSRNWNEIVSKEYNFDRLEKEVRALADIKVDEVTDYYKKLMTASDSYRKLSVHIIGAKVEGQGEETQERLFELNLLKENENCILDICEFKAKLKAYPVLYIID